VKLPDWIAVVSAAIAALSLFVALLQYLDVRRRGAAERERLAQQRERLRTSVSAATMGVLTADLMVQRAKEDDATLVELQNLARVLRGNLNILATQLDDESKQPSAGIDAAAYTSVRRPGAGLLDSP
jgi:hypothetical protein